MRHSEHRELLSEIEQLGVCARRLIGELDRIEREMAELDQKGATDATPHYKANKYLYLIHPQKDGQREREYVGADRVAQASALARVERFKRKRQLGSAAAAMRSSLSGATYSVREALRRMR